MSRTTVAWDDVLEADDQPYEHPVERGWRAFLRSWKWAVILAVACVLGLVAIFTAVRPFASASVSERVSDALGRTVSCQTAGVTTVAGEQTTVYRCGALTETGGGPTQCFTVSGRDVKQLSGNRKLGC